MTLPAKPRKRRLYLGTGQSATQSCYLYNHARSNSSTAFSFGINKPLRACIKKKKDQYIILFKKSLLRLNSFIDEITNFFKPDKLILQRQYIDLNQLLTDEIETLQNLQDTHQVAMAISLSGNVDSYSDLVWVRTILTNILSNAMKYCDVRKTSCFMNMDVNVSAD